jgi:hypothetical protein
VQELIGMAVTLDAAAAAGGAGPAAAPPTPTPTHQPHPPLGTVVDVYSGTGPFDTLRIALHGPGLYTARAAAAAEGAAVIDEGGGGGGGGGGGSEGEGGGGAPDASGTDDTIPPSPAALASAPSLLLPFADAFVLDVSRDDRTMRVAPPPGLLGLAMGGAGGGGARAAGGGKPGKAKKAGRRGGDRRGALGARAGGMVPGPTPNDPAWAGRKGADAHES